MPWLLSAFARGFTIVFSVAILLTNCVLVKPKSLNLMNCVCWPIFYIWKAASHLFCLGKHTHLVNTIYICCNKHRAELFRTARLKKKSRNTWKKKQLWLINIPVFCAKLARKWLPKYNSGLSFNRLFVCRTFDSSLAHFSVRLSILNFLV